MVVHSHHHSLHGAHYGHIWHQERKLAKPSQAGTWARTPAMCASHADYAQGGMI